MTPVSIAHITPSYLPTAGGKESYIFDVVEGLSEFRFFVLCARVLGARVSQERGRATVSRIGPPDLYRGPRALPSPGRLELFLSHGLSTVRLARQRRLAQECGAQVVHSHWSDIEFAEALRGVVPATTRARLVDRALQVATFSQPTVFTDHSMFLQPLSYSEGRLLEHALRTYEAVVCVEPEGVDRAKAISRDIGGHADVTYVPNSVNCTAFAPAGDGGRRDLTIGFLGRANKGHGIVLDLVRRLKEFRFLLIVAGDRRSLKKWRSITSNRVELAENVLPWDLPGLLTRADVVVSPLLHPAITRVTLESLACGIPVVAAAGESRYPLIDERTGLLVPAEPDAFERALRTILTNSALRESMGREGRRIVEAEFSDPVVLPRLASLYRQLAA